MGRSPGRTTIDWGKRPDDPFLRELYRNPKRLAKLHVLVTIGMVLFWAFLVLGLLIVAGVMLL